MSAFEGFIRHWQKRRFVWRKAFVVLHDVMMTWMGLGLTAMAVPPFVISYPYGPLLMGGLAIGVFTLAGLYQSRWRFASLPDLIRLFWAVSGFVLLLATLQFSLMLTWQSAPPSASGLLIYGFVLLGLLACPRLFYRYFRYQQRRMAYQEQEAPRALLLGSPSDLDQALLSLEGFHQPLLVSGLLSLDAQHQGLTLRGHKVAGGPEAFDSLVEDLVQRETPVQQLLLLPSALQTPDLDLLISKARARNLMISQLHVALGTYGEANVVPVSAEDLLLRPRLTLDPAPMKVFVKGRHVCVTGGGGSIGAVLCQQLAAYGVSELTVLDQSEAALHRLVLDLQPAVARGLRLHAHLADVRDFTRLESLFKMYEPHMVFHAAALKHVPYLETDWAEAVRTNVLGTANTLKAAQACGVSLFVLISTDKAVHPVSVLGHTKRAAERLTHAFDGSFDNFRAVAVRFGNVLGSAGSATETFQKQIAQGGPVTVTDKDMVRYFMTPREAVDLVVCAAAHALHSGPSRFAAYLLNMGQPVTILSLAERMIRLAGLRPHHDIPIVFTGIRPGERLHESVARDDEPQHSTDMEGLVALGTAPLSFAHAQACLTSLEEALARGEREVVQSLMLRLEAEEQERC